MSTPSQHIRGLTRRLLHLTRRLSDSNHHSNSYDAQEASALAWVLAFVIDESSSERVRQAASNAIVLFQNRPRAGVDDEDNEPTNPERPPMKTKDV